MTCFVCTKHWFATRQPANFRDETVWGLQKGPEGTGSAWSVLGQNSFYRKTCVTRRGGRHVVKRSSDPRQGYPEAKL